MILSEKGIETPPCSSQKSRDIGTPNFPFGILNPRLSQDEIAVFREIVRELKLKPKLRFFYGIYQTLETPKSTINHFFKGLWPYIGVQPLIVLVPFTMATVRFAAKKFSLLKVIPPNGVKFDMTKVFTQSAESPQGVKLAGFKSSCLVSLSQVNSIYS